MFRRAVTASVIALGALMGAAGIATADVHHDIYAWEVGDDNADGVIQEDESGWDWRTMGNRCGTDDPSIPVICLH